MDFKGDEYESRTQRQGLANRERRVKNTSQGGQEVIASRERVPQMHSHLEVGKNLRIQEKSAGSCTATMGEEEGQHQPGTLSLELD